MHQPRSRLQQILVLSREHELVSLVMDSNRGSDYPLVPFSLQIDDLQSRVQGVARMDFIEEGAGELNERNEGLANEMREKRRARGCKRKHLKAVYHRSGMAVPRRPDRIIVNRMIVCRHALERYSMCVGQRAAGRAKDVANLQVGKLLFWHD